MEQTLYIDVVFLVSLCMDAFLLWAAGRLSGFSALLSEYRPQN